MLTAGDAICNDRIVAETVVNFVQGCSLGTTVDGCEGATRLFQISRKLLSLPCLYVQGRFRAKLADIHLISERLCLLCGHPEDDVDHAVWSCGRVQARKRVLIEQLGDNYQATMSYVNYLRNSSKKQSSLTTWRKSCASARSVVSGSILSPKVRRSWILPPVNNR